MNDHTFLCSFFFHHPTFICASDGSAILANQAAERVFNNIFEGKKLTEIISKYDKFRFEFAMQSKKPQPIIAAATLVLGYSHICFVFGNIAKKSTALAIFAKSYEEAQKLAKHTDYPDFSHSINSFAEAILENSAVDCLTYSDISLFDPHIITERLIFDHSSSDVRLIYNKNDQASHSYYSDMGLYAFVCYFTMASAAIEEISLDKNINICILPLKDSFELRFETQIRLDAYSDEFSSEALGSPKIDTLLRLCDFIAGCSQCTFTVYQKEKNMVLSLISTELDEETDFKSHDQFENYACALEYARVSLEAICTEAAQA